MNLVMTQVVERINIAGMLSEICILISILLFALTAETLKSRIVFLITTMILAAIDFVIKVLQLIAEVLTEQSYFTTIVAIVGSVILITMLAIHLCITVKLESKRLIKVKNLNLMDS